MSKQNYINHVTLLLDASGSMGHLQQKVVKVTDDLVAFLAQKSREDKEETRISVYSFDDQVECHIWDMDVFRLPSVKGLYKIKGMTALADAVHACLDDTEMVPEKYGTHDWTYYLLTDGFENASRTRDGKRPGFGRVPLTLLQEEMQKRFAELPANRTMLGLAPEERSAQQLYDFGFERGNVALWDATTEEGLERAVERIKDSYTSYVATRAATGVRGTRTAFSVGGQIDAQAVKKNLVPLAHTAYDITVVTKSSITFEKFAKPTKAYPKGKSLGFFARIDDFINKVAPPFTIGKGYYELVKREKIQGNKDVAVMEKKTSQVYVGQEARHLIGLPDHDISVKPDFNPDWTIFVRSTSDNRHLPVGSRVLVKR